MQAQRGDKISCPEEKECAAGEWRGSCRRSLFDHWRLGAGPRSRRGFRQPFREYWWNGQIKIKGRRTEGEYGSDFGLQTAWYSNGQKAFERTFDEQVPFSYYMRKPWTEWHKNGIKKAQRIKMPNEYEEVEGPYYDRITQWYDNCQKYTEGDVKHGENAANIVNWLGSHRQWYASGQLKCEWLTTDPPGIKAWYENGKPLFENPKLYVSKGKFWDEQGNVSERYRPEDVCPQYEILYLTEAHLY